MYLSTYILWLLLGNVFDNVFPLHFCRWVADAEYHAERVRACEVGEPSSAPSREPALELWYFISNLGFDSLFCLVLLSFGFYFWVLGVCVAVCSGYFRWFCLFLSMYLWMLVTRISVWTGYLYFVCYLFLYYYGRFLFSSSFLWYFSPLRLSSGVLLIFR